MAFLDPSQTTRNTQNQLIIMWTDAAKYPHTRKHIHKTHISEFCVNGRDESDDKDAMRIYVSCERFALVAWREKWSISRGKDEKWGMEKGGGWVSGWCQISCYANREWFLMFLTTRSVRVKNRTWCVSVRWTPLGLLFHSLSNAILLMSKWQRGI